MTDVGGPSRSSTKNLQTGADATLTNGQFTLTHDGLKKKFFGKNARITVRFPIADGENVVTADPTTFVGPSPRQVIVNVGNKTFSTQNAPGSIDLDIREISTINGDAIRIALTGEVRSADGKKKTADVLLEATLR